LQGVRIERLRLTVEPEIVVPVLLLASADVPRRRGGSPRPPACQAVVVAFSQQGKEHFLRERAGEIAALVAGGVTVCLPDLRGTGETCPPVSRELRGEATAISATEWMLGQTLLGSRLRDLRSVLRYLRTRPDADAARFALWGDSFAPMNLAGDRRPTGFPDPLLGEEEPPGRQADGRPTDTVVQSEPLGGLLALFGALVEDGIAAVAVRGSLAGYLSVLGDAYCYVPHDAIVPGALTAGDLCDVAAALAPCPLRLEGLVDGRNCRLPETDVKRLFEPTVRAYCAVEGALMIRTEPASDLAPWLLDSLSDQTQ
jgi:hypothetical protein